MDSVDRKQFTLADWLNDHPKVRNVLEILLGIGTITCLHVYLGFLWTAGICLFLLCVWASGPWVTHDQYLIRYKPDEYIKKRFTNPDGTPKRPFNESGLGTPFGDPKLLRPALGGMLEMRKQDQLDEAARRAV